MANVIEGLVVIMGAGVEVENPPSLDDAQVERRQGILQGAADRVREGGMDPRGVMPQIEPLIAGAHDAGRGLKIKAGGAGGADDEARWVDPNARQRRVVADAAGDAVRRAILDGGA